MPTSEGHEQRRLRSDERITSATLDLLRAHGPKAVTVEAVSGASGVAKTTIYRRFANRREMLQSALATLTDNPPPAPEVPTKEKVRWAVASAREALEDTLGLSSVGAILANDDQEFTDSVRAVLTPHTEVLVGLMNSAVAAGNMRRNVDNNTVLSLILGACLGEQLRFGSVRDEWLDHTVDALWSGIGVGGGVR